MPHEAVIARFAPIPYLNGGLFECLDGEDPAANDRKVYRDGFSRRADRRAFLPNALFFGDGHGHEGLLPLLKRYDFTLDENHATDADIALDPELLGKVFENLLATYNPETGKPARKATGSFYTPREIVDYMVDQALRATLAPHADTPALDALFAEAPDAADALPDPTRAALRERLETLKALDPACGSGAFPMGLLNRMAELLERLGDRREPYNRKLALIQNTIHGVDIQPIAIQIAKLRFFIALLCEQTPDPAKPNAGLDQLPNLETHLVIANALIGFNDGEDYLIPPHIEALRAQLKALRANYVQAHTRADKLKLRAQDKALRGQIQDYFRSQHLAGVDRLAEWDPYDPTVASPFFDPQWMFGLPSFDIVIGNPPYHQEKKGIFSARQFPWSEGMDKGKQNLYKVFVEQGYNLAKKGGTVCLIVQSSLMCDLSATATRELLLRHTRLLQILEFPKDTDDPEVKVFKSVLTGTCIVLFLKEEPQAATFSLSIHNTLQTILAPQFTSLSQPELIRGGRNLEFPLLHPKEGPLFLKLKTRFRPLATLLTGKRQGNINTIHLNKIHSRHPTSILIAKGENIHRYLLDENLMFGQDTKFVRGLATDNHDGEVVVCQNITGTTDNYRIHACRAECKKTNIVFLHSANIAYLPSPRAALLTVGLLNSHLLDWIFRTTSTNNHVNLYELEELPIPSEAALQSAETDELVALVRHAETGKDVQAEIDAMVYRLYGLTAEEIALVEASFARRTEAKGARRARGTGAARPVEDEDDDEEA